MTLSIHQQNRETIINYWRALDTAAPEQLPAIIRAYTHADSAWHGPQPLNDLAGVDALIEQFWLPLRHSFPNLQRQPQLLLAGEYGGQHWVSASGYLKGAFARDWLGIPASGQDTLIRFGEIMALHEGKIARTYFLLDLIDVMGQGGFQLGLAPPATEGLRPPVKTGSGLLTAAQDPAETRKTLLLIEAMLFGLVRKDQPMSLYWHDEMIWNSPSGIGTARGLREFDVLVLDAFRRGLSGAWDGAHNARYAEGRFAVSTGWPSLISVHDGDFLGIPASGNTLRWRIMDFWEREDNLLIRNWVHIDMIDVFGQMGVDVFERLRQHQQRKH